MKIAFIVLDLNSKIGGMQNFNQRVVRSFKDGDEITIFSLHGNSTTYSDKKVIGNNGRKLLLILRVAIYLLRNHVERVLFGHIFLTPLFLLTRLFAFNAQHILFVHGIEVWREYNKSNYLLKASVFQMDKILSVSKFTIDKMRENGYSTRKITKIFNCIDIRESNLAKEGKSDNIKLVCVSRLDEWEKGFACLIESIQILHRKNINVRVDLVGDGVLRKPIDKMITDHELDGIISMRGKVDDATLKEIYSQGDIFVLPSRKEGFGIVFLEAWNNGLPVICGDTDASSEVVTNGLNGFCIDPNSPIELANKIRILSEDDNLRQKMADEGRKLLISTYNQENFAKIIRKTVLEMRE